MLSLSESTRETHLVRRFKKLSWSTIDGTAAAFASAASKSKYPKSTNQKSTTLLLSNPKSKIWPSPGDPLMVHPLTFQPVTMNSTWMDLDCLKRHRKKPASCDDKAFEAELEDSEDEDSSLEDELEHDSWPWTISIALQTYTMHWSLRFRLGFGRCSCAAL